MIGLLGIAAGAFAGNRIAFHFSPPKPPAPGTPTGVVSTFNIPVIVGTLAGALVGWKLSSRIG
jgi:hypothetical protein